MQRSANHDQNPSIEDQQAYWDDRWAKQRTPNEWQTRRAQAILAMLRDLRLEQPRILDLGCATGWMTKLLSELGTAEGLDLSEEAIARARSRFPGIKYTAGDLYQISLTGDLVDVVVCQEVIAHVSDQPELIRRIADVIKPGGYLVISAANRFVMNRIRDEDGIVGVGPADPEEHIKKWLGRRELKRLLSPQFTVLRTASVIPMGHRGVLRLVNSDKLGRVVGWVLPGGRFETLKEWMGLGYSIIALGRKK